MEINSRNNAQAFTGFKITHKTRQGAAKLIEDITKDFYRKESRPEEFGQYQKSMIKSLQDEIIEPLKNVKAEVEYDDGRIFVRSADKTKTVEIDRGKDAPLHPKETTVVQYRIKGDECCMKVDYGTRQDAEKAAKSLLLRGPFADLMSAREIAKHFDTLDAKKLTAEAAKNAYQERLDSLADDLLGSL